MADFEENVEDMVGTTREAAGGDRVRRGRDRRSRDEAGDQTAATAGDERDGGDRWGYVYGRGELEFELTSAIFVWRALRILRWWTLRKTLKILWGRLQKRRVATESSGDETGGPGDETGDKTATAGDE